MAGRQVTGRRIGAVMATAALLLLTGARIAAAHPLGNFSTNTATGLTVAPDAIYIDRILDLAEIPTLRAIQAAGGADERALEGSAADRLRDTTCHELRTTLTLTVDGRPVPITDGGPPTLSFPPGEAGLPTLRLECPLVATVDLGPRPRTVVVTDAVYADRLGWREITAVGDRVELTATDVPPVSSSSRLVSYPEEGLTSPLDLRTATLQVRAGGAAFEALPVPAAIPDPVARGLDRLSGAFAALVAVERLTLPFALLAIVVAAALGTLHALAPGHGKTVIAAYLVGRQGTARDAFLLGGTVAVTHTLGVFLLGTVLSATAMASPERLYPWLGVTSGLLFAAVGMLLLRQARQGGGHVHGPGGHIHGADGRIILVPLDAATAERPTLTPARSATVLAPAGRPAGQPGPSGHLHDHPQEHRSDLPPPGGVAAGAGVMDHDHDGSRLTAPPGLAGARPGHWRGLVAPGLAGGLVPSPSALLVLLGGFAIGRAWFGVGLVVAYGIGMALTLVGAGYLLLRVRARLDAATAHGHRSARMLRIGRLLPTVTAALIVVGGLLIVGRSLLAL